MNILKTKKLFTYMVVGALVMALSISCKSNEEPTDNTHSNHPPSGTYKGTVGSITTTAIVTTSGGTCNIKGTGYNYLDTSKSLAYDITITKWSRLDTTTSRYLLGDPHAGGQGEATINSPINPTHFRVDYYNDGRISVYVNEYQSGDMTRQE